MPKRISQSDIAKQVGVNASTVSRALHNDPRITAEVRNRILEAAQKLGYRPDPAVSALANYRWKSKPRNYSGTVAWITVGDSPRELRRKFPEYDLYWTGAKTCADRFGYRIEEFSITEKTTLSQIEKILYARNVKGLLLPPEHHPFLEWGQLHDANYSIVRLSRSVHNLEVHLVTTNLTADGLLAFRKIHEHGYKRIGFVGIKVENRLFYPGFSWGQHNQPQSEYIPPLFLDGFPSEQHPEVLAQWIEQYKPDAILEDFAGFYDLLEQIGYRIPTDIAVATQNTLRNPGTAGILQNLEEVGRVAMLILISLISDHDYGIPPISRQVLVKGTWTDGASLPSLVN
ncbi:LacI family DNA-binding transcriptional regulator [Pontiellaceae bacterium B12219]|nr:LacI family DNA-binding transcriptional regulator [Pontiellaceae bacterium B12219]